MKSFPSTARSGATSFYRTAMNHPKTSAAVVLGTGAAAALVWLARRNGGFGALHREILARVRGLPEKVREALPGRSGDVPKQDY
ncbi:MAG: hypothetical protein ACT4P4_25585 [Betaproteobacteria bacterium]